jgi:uncharacterized phosphosugar-binding protein
VTAATRYLQTLQGLLEDLAGRTAEELEVLAHRIADSLSVGGVLHVFGTGHSQLVAQELAERAGGLAAVDAIVVPALSPSDGQRAAAAERLAGYGQLIVDAEDLRAGEVLVIVSNSGINVVPIEVAMAASRRGLFVVAVISRAHCLAAPTRHPDGLRLLDVADLTLDTGAPSGDAAIALPNGAATGPLSTVVAAAVLHAVLARTAELMAVSGAAPPVLVSQNLADHDVNAGLFARYADRTGRRP